jgi:predicted Zn finger-like uncharacterized protein
VIVSCPACGKRYRIDPARLRATRRLRCAACGLVFDRDAAGPAPAAGPATAVAPRGPLVLLADEGREFRDLVQATLADLGCAVEVTDDGESAFRLTAARRPALVIMNVYLKRLLGVAVCEGIKGSPDLRAIKVVLIGTVFKSDRFVRAPGHLYGADDYFEDVIPRAELRARLQRIITGKPAAGPAGPRPGGAAGPWSRTGAPGAGELEAAEAAALDALGDGTPSPEPASEDLDPPAEIRRLARIMISDLKIYYPDEFRSALLERRFSETFREELGQAKALIVRRFPGLPERMEILAAALKEGLAQERDAAARVAGAR